MKIVVIGGTGLIGSKTVPMLRQGGHEVVAASPNTGVNSITGEGLEDAMAGTQVVIDLANSPSFEDRRCWNSSRPPGATFSRRRRQPVSGTMSRSPSSERTGRRTMAISAPRWPRRD
jgi:NAD dependent epimerase/dehydratase family enzyme